MIEPADPTFLCHAYAAWKLLANNKPEQAEDELAQAFGFSVHRIDKDGKRLGKLTIRNNMSPEMAEHTSKQLAALYELHVGKPPPASEA